MEADLDPRALIPNPDEPPESVPASPSGESGDGSDSTPDLTVSFELVKQAQEGKAEALNRLFERYYERVRRIVRLRIGTLLRSRLDSADILQETFIQAIRSFDRFEMRDEASLINWLSKIAEHQIIAQADRFGAKKRDIRRERPMPAADGDDSTSGTPYEPPDSSSGPLDKLRRKELQEIVEEAIGELPEEYRELIILRNYAGASWALVAEQTGRPSEAAARMMHARAMIDLGRLVRDRGGEL